MNSAEATSQATRMRAAALALRGVSPAHVPPTPRGNGRLDRKGCSLTVSPFSEVAFS